MEKVQNNKADQRSTRDENHIRLTADTIPSWALTALPDGSVDFINQRWLEYLGLTLEDVRGWGWTLAMHPDDVERFVTEWRALITSLCTYDKIDSFSSASAERQLDDRWSCGPSKMKRLTYMARSVNRLLFG